jgi:hypothetical protein
VTKKIPGNFDIQHIQHLCRVRNPGLSEYEAGIIYTQLRHSVKSDIPEPVTAKKN